MVTFLGALSDKSDFFLSFHFRKVIAIGMEYSLKELRWLQDQTYLNHLYILKMCCITKMKRWIKITMVLS